jgi:hypothetical protein
MQDDGLTTAEATVPPRQIPEPSAAIPARPVGSTPRERRKNQRQEPRTGAVMVRAPADPKR